MTPPVAIPDTLVAALAGRYTLERELGRGGMAAVYLARDLRHDRLVALKVIHTDLAGGPAKERSRGAAPWSLHPRQRSCRSARPQRRCVTLAGELGDGGRYRDPLKRLASLALAKL
ncbi:MAG TPA: hypothetical protein VM094_02315 [Gemmatimonadales bacterium]|nr:hypothetical protein [Gemmatimonadales bacterium]